MNINMLTKRVIDGDITENEILDIMNSQPLDEALPNLKKLKLNNGWEIHQRTDADYVWIVGREKDECWELGIGLYLALVKSNIE